MARILVLVFITALFPACTFPNVFEGQDSFCRGTMAELPRILEQQVAREASRQPPNGALQSPYSRELWDAYWNDRIYHAWDIGPESCGGTYEGPAGPDMIRVVLARRRAAGLPDVNLDERNRDKALREQ